MTKVQGARQISDYNSVSDHSWSARVYNYNHRVLECTRGGVTTTKIIHALLEIFFSGVDKMYELFLLRSISFSSCTALSAELAKRLTRAPF